MKSEVKYNDGFATSDSKFAQNGLGAIYIETLFYDHQQETYMQVIKIYHKAEGYNGWGKKIFEGTLKDLITLIETPK